MVRIAVFAIMSLWGHYMSHRSVLVSSLLACLAAAGFLGISSGASVAAGPSILQATGSVQTDVIKVGRRGHGSLTFLPIAPTYRAYDYPYYYSRGYYPTHIGPGYIYHAPIYSYGSSAGYSSGHGDRCTKWHSKCAANWGSKTEDYYGCMEYHDCD